MLYPSVNSLLKRVDSRYTLVALIAKRARQLNRENQDKEENGDIKSVTMAIKEIEEGKIGYIRTKDGIK